MRLVRRELYHQGGKDLNPESIAEDTIGEELNGFEENVFRALFASLMEVSVHTPPGIKVIMTAVRRQAKENDIRHYTADERAGFFWLYRAKNPSDKNLPNWTIVSGVGVDLCHLEMVLAKNRPEAVSEFIVNCIKRRLPRLLRILKDPGQLTLIRNFLGLTENDGWISEK